MTATTTDAPESASLNEKQLVARAIRATAARVQLTHPATHADGHLRDAARMLERGYTQAATRHLDAARRTLSAQTLYRHGVFDDASHGQAALHGGQIIRHMLRVRDIQDVGEAQERRAVQAKTNQLAEDERKRQRAMQPPTTVPTGGSGGAAAGPAQPNPVGTFKGAPRDALQGRDATLVGMSWELSAETGRLAVTPAPRGRPGGPGLYDVKNLGHTPYLQQIVKALIEKRGLPPGRAYAIARGAIRKWSRGGGHVHPEVQAASAAAEAGENAKQALAKAAHGHAGDWDAVELAIRLATGPMPYHRDPDENVQCPHCGKYDDTDAVYCDQCGWKLPASAYANLSNPNWAQQSRVPAGQAGGGQFGTMGATRTPPGSKGKAPAHGKPAVKGKPSPVTAHGTRAQQKAALLKQAASDRAQARKLMVQLAQLLHASKRATAKNRAATKAGATGKTTAPTPAKKTGTAAAGARKPGARKPTRAQQIAGLRKQIASLLAQANQLTAQAAKL